MFKHVQLPDEGEVMFPWNVCNFYHTTQHHLPKTVFYEITALRLSYHAKI
jgi:hypothetical protein